MNWTENLKGNALHWLLDPADAGVRYLALRDLCDLPADNPELIAARQRAYEQGPIAAVTAAMQPQGYWVEGGPGYLPKYTSTVWAVLLLAQLGASARQDARIRRACAYLLDHALAARGRFSSDGNPSGTADCLQGNLCWALLALEYEDPRLETAFDWMARSVTGDGVAPAEDRQADLRYYAGKCGPNFACGANNRLPCAWGAAKVMLAFGSYPSRQRSALIEKAVQSGLEFLLGTDPASAAYPTGYSGKPSGNWWKFGFPVFYVTDILQIVEAVVALGRGADPRLANAEKLILEKQDEQGRWMLEYDYAGKTYGNFGVKKTANKWVTLRALRAIKGIHS